MHARQPDEHTRVADVVVLQIVSGRIGGDELVALSEVHPNDERAWLR